MKPAESYDNFSAIKERLDLIVDQVSADDMPLEQALSLYEEAVKLGVRVSALIEDNQGDENDASQGSTDQTASEPAVQAEQPLA